MREGVLNIEIIEGLKGFIDYANLAFAGSYIFILFVIDLYIAKDKKHWKFLDKVPRLVEALVLGTLLMTFCIFVLEMTGKMEILGMLLGVFVGMAAYELGIAKVLRKIFKED